MKTIHRKRLIIIISTFVGLILTFFIAFAIYVNDYYHAMNYDIPQEFTDIIIEEYDDYTIYGDVDSVDKGIIFYPGGKVEAKAYEPLMYYLADEDICCVLVEMPFNLAVFGINSADEIIGEYSEIEWYIAGHSLGGAMASSYASDKLDVINGLILLAAYPTDVISSDVPVISIYGSEDKVLNVEKYNESKKLASDFTEVIIQGGNHSGFGNYGFQSGDGEPSISSQSQWEATVEYIMDWINQKEPE